MALTSPLDLEQILITDLAGGTEIFSFVAMVMLGWTVGKFKFSNTESLVVFTLFTVIMAAYLPAIYVLVNLFVGIFVAYAISKITK